ncbi:hypothetical protein KC19_12G181000 [Ceratodon purpureus]|uniref:Protein kinase domain-containing protein n=1 Tax=Ceratodon purpureus TaxID=3225 RepID=A0A8T0GEG7_CERPU|nr:hypothetical protein KC19_12G181000 [Ceratodon purpureus]
MARVHRLVSQDKITMIENFELSDARKSKLLHADFSHDGHYILNTQCEFDISKFIRLSIESFPDTAGLVLKAFHNVCFTEPQKSEELCFIISNAANQWVREVFGHENSESKTILTNSSISDSIIESNSLLYLQYWSQLGDEARTRLHFPSRMLQEAFVERKALKTKLQEWIKSGEDCKIGMHKRGPESTSRTQFWSEVWKIQDADEDADVIFENYISELQGIWRVKWRGGTFACKEKPLTGKEFEVVNRVSSHPNVVFGVGEFGEEKDIPRAFFMEYMGSGDLFNLIIDSSRKRGDSLPPFSSIETLDILSQTAKAMKHIHEEGHVVHCDLKPENILISEIAISDNSKHYLVKVADFGSAQYFGGLSSEFAAGHGTDRYAAPEALQQRKDKSFVIGYPDRIDVYSFGIVAFEVLTGDTGYMLTHFPPRNLTKAKESRQRVINGSLRPPLRAECRKSEQFKSTTWAGIVQQRMKNWLGQDKESTPTDVGIDRCWHLQDEELISLIESCWHSDPWKRPTFIKICDDLKKAKVRISRKITKSDLPPSQENSLAGPSGASKITSEGICDVDQEALDSCTPCKRARKSGVNIL